MALTGKRGRATFFTKQQNTMTKMEPAPSSVRKAAGGGKGRRFLDMLSPQSGASFAVTGEL